MSIRTYKIVSISFWVMMALSGIGLFWSILYDATYTRLFGFISLTSTVGMIANSFIFDMLNDEDV